jgi:hypothetical protein
MGQTVWNIQEQGDSLKVNGGINIAFRHWHRPPQPGANLIAPDRDYFTRASGQIADITSELTVVGGRSVFAAGDFASLNQAPPPAMPDWSPVRSFDRDGSWGSAKAPQHFALNMSLFAVLRRPWAQPCYGLVQQSACFRSQDLSASARLRLLAV